MNPQNPHHPVYPGHQYYPQHYSGPGDNPLPRQDAFSNHNSPYSTPSGHASHYQGALQERPDQALVQPRVPNFYPNSNVSTDPRPFEHSSAPRATPLGLDTDLKNGRYAPHGTPITATKPTAMGWHDGTRYSSESKLMILPQTFSYFPATIRYTWLLFKLC